MRKEGFERTKADLSFDYIRRATKYAKEENLFGEGPGQVQYREGDFMVRPLLTFPFYSKWAPKLTLPLNVQHIPYPDNHFDFVYATEATVYAPSLKAVYTETARVLKPGGVFGVYEWLMTDDFDAKNAQHVEIRQRIERGDGVVNMLTVREGLEAFGGSGYVIYSGSPCCDCSS